MTKRTARQKIDVFVFIELARHHKKYCEGEKCNISLLLLAEYLENTGIKLTKKERREFF